jgi:hypothetical protein
MFTETRTPQGNWVAEKTDTYREQSSPVNGSIYRTMEETPCPRDLPLFGLLCDEAWESLPWSFWQRGMPEDASTQVKAVSQDWEEESFGHTHLTLQELVEKYQELKEDPRPQARKLEHSLGEMLYALYASAQAEVAPEHRRVVFWFH